MTFVLKFCFFFVRLFVARTTSVCVVNILEKKNRVMLMVRFVYWQGLNLKCFGARAFCLVVALVSLGVHVRMCSNSQYFLHSITLLDWFWLEFSSFFVCFVCFVSIFHCATSNDCVRFCIYLCRMSDKCAQHTKLARVSERDHGIDFSCSFSQIST